MKTQYVETYSLKELADQGYKQRLSGEGYYLGNSKYPTHTISVSQEHLLGQKLKLIGVREGKVQVDALGEEYYVPNFLLKTKIKRAKTARMIHKDEVLKFNGYSFDFPYSSRHMGRESAIRMAKWILQVTK